MTNENVIETRYMMFYFGDDLIEGDVWLTDEEYEIVSKVLNPKNWENVHRSGPYIPTIRIKKYDD